MSTTNYHCGRMGIWSILGERRTLYCYECYRWLVSFGALDEVSSSCMHVYCVSVCLYLSQFYTLQFNRAELLRRYPDVKVGMGTTRDLGQTGPDDAGDKLTKTTIKVRINIVCLLNVLDTKDMQLITICNGRTLLLITCMILSQKSMYLIAS